MVRSFEEWWNSLPKELRLKARMGDEDKKPLLNQINYIWVTNLMNKRLDLNPTSIELLEWIRTGQIDEIRKDESKKNVTV